MLNINLYFPTVIAVDYNETLAVSLLPVAKKYLHECTSTNNLDYKSTYNADQGIENNNDVAPFLNYINEKEARKPPFLLYLNALNSIQ